MMRVAVVGLGGVGGYFGGKLAGKYAGRLSTVWPLSPGGSHLAAIRREGPLLRTVEGECRVRPDIVTARPAEAGPCDLVRSR